MPPVPKHRLLCSVTFYIWPHRGDFRSVFSPFEGGTLVILLHWLLLEMGIVCEHTISQCQKTNLLVAC